MKKTVIIFLSILIIFICPLNVSVQAQDYSKLNGEIYEKFESMQEGDKTSVLLYLSYDNTENSTEGFYKDIEAANNDFLGRYPSIAVENVYYISKYKRQIAVSVDKYELSRFLNDSEVISITDFNQELELSSGITGADVQYAVDEYLNASGNIDLVGAYPQNIGESNGIPLICFRMLPTTDEVKYIRIKNYVFVAHGCNALYDLGYYALIDGKLETFENALRTTHINLDEAAEVYGDAYKIQCLGDMDLSGKTDIRDVTLLQKALAGLEPMPEITMDFEDKRGYDVTDYDGDGKVNIRDATAMQKHLAGIEY